MFDRDIEIRDCPSCGSKAIRCMRAAWTGTYRGRKYTVPDLHWHECPDCGERLYGPEAMRRIQAVSPAFAKRRRLRKTA